MLVSIPRQFTVDADGQPRVGAKWYFYEAGTDTPAELYSTPDYSQELENPVSSLGGGYFPAVYINPADYPTHKQVLEDADGLVIFTEDDLATTIDSTTMFYRRGEVGSVASAVSSVLGRFVWIEDFGGAPGADDNSAAFNAALTALVALGGGELRFGTVGEWRMNVVIAADNIKLVGYGGRAEFDVNCIRPYSLTSAAITWGDGSNTYRYCGMRNLAISGTDDVGGANYDQAAHSAPHCLLIRGGMIGFRTEGVWLYNGIRTLSLETTVDAPITGLRFVGGGGRNDLEDSVDARTIYANRLGIGLSDGYYTDNVFIDAKFNGPGGLEATKGYLAEFDGTTGGIIAEFLNTYLDFRTDFVNPTTVCHGILMKGGNSFRGHALTLDAGSTGAVYIESDQAPYDVARLLSGSVFCNGGGLIKFAGPVYVELPSEAEHFFYQPRINRAHLTGPVRFTTTTDPFDIDDLLPFLDTDSTAGPITVNRSDWSVKTAGNGLRVKEGANCKQGTATLVAGSVVVGNTSVTANSRIFLSRSTLGGAAGHLSYTISAGVSFTITSSSGTDTSTINYEIFEPA